MTHEKPRVREVIIVEGRYDKNALLQAVDATVLETRGFGVFKNGELRALLWKLAEKQRLIVLTDSDGAGFVIRNHLRGVLPEGTLHAYIPDRYGKERRKREHSAEGKLGVEGMPPEVLIRALRDAGATFEGAEMTESSKPGGRITKADLYEWGLSGSPDSAARRGALQQTLDLPEHLTANAFLEAINLLYDRDDIIRLVLTK